MERYLLFTDCYYPGGGWNDFQGDFDSIEDAENKALELDGDWLQIIDTTSKFKVRNK